MLTAGRYVEGILKSTKLSVEQVTIEPDGTWSENVAAETSFPPSGATAFSPGDGDDDDDDDDDDLVEIQDIRVNALKQEAGSRSSPLHRTPPASSREQSTASSRPSSNKRPSSAVIALTLSDDEELAAPPPKRPYYDPSSTSAGLPHRNGEGESTRGSHANTVPGGITFGIPNSIGRQFYQANGY
jgi:E3 SUMO-protein ligase PIAS1